METHLFLQHWTGLEPIKNNNNAKTIDSTVNFRADTSTCPKNLCYAKRGFVRERAKKANSDWEKKYEIISCW